MKDLLQAEVKVTVGSDAVELRLVRISDERRRENEEEKEKEQDKKEQRFRCHGHGH